MMRSVAVAIVCACAVSACESGHHGFDFAVTVHNIPPSITEVRFGDEPIAVERGQAAFETHFASWTDGLAAGRIDVVFSSGGSEVGRGSVAVGACAQCTMAGCPTVDQLRRESLEYVSLLVTPDDIECFTCEGGGHVVRACR